MAFLKPTKPKIGMELRTIAREDVVAVWRMQVEAFSKLLVTMFELPWTTYYFIIVSDEKSGGDLFCGQKRQNQKTDFPHLDHKEAQA